MIELLLPKRVGFAVAWLATMVALFSTPARAQNVSNAFWQGQSIYQIITDRFYDGDVSNNNADGNYDPAGHSGTSVHGGDFKGVEQKLDYIKALGATAIWISPVVLNANGEFHGYAARDFYKVDPHWGTLADLQHLIQAAHARGLLVIDDIVVNHGGDLINSSDAGYSNFRPPPGGYVIKYRNSSKTFAAPFDSFNLIYNSFNNALTNYFHNNGVVTNFNDDTQVVYGELSGLDDFRTESDYVRTNMAAIYNYWISQGFDGFRIDTTKHVDMGFWQTWCPIVHAYAATNGLPNFFMFGEVIDDDVKCGSYTGTIGGGPFKQDSVLDYPLYFLVNNVFASATGNTKQIEDHYNAIATDYDTNSQMRLVTFLDNHDQPRFLSIGGATTNRLQVALTFLFTGRGIPTLYYGTEQGFNGPTDPFNREDMFAGQFKDGPGGVDSFNMTHPLFLLTAELNNFRRLYPALRLGSHVNKWNDPDSPGLFAYARRLATGAGTTQEVFVVLNTSTSTQTLANRSTVFTAGTQIVNLFDTNEILTVATGPMTPQITMPGTSAKIFVEQSDWRPLDPVVISNFPAHDAVSVPTTSSIVLQFSSAMDTNRVQAAFSTAPAVTGAFNWSAAHDLMTFTASGSGFPRLTNIVVLVTNSATDVSSNAMFAPYQMQFHTAGVTDVSRPTILLLTPAIGSVISNNLQISGTASDDTAVQKVEIQLDNGVWTVANGTNSWNLNLNSSNFLNGPHLVNARATDTSGNISPTNSASVRFFNVPGDYLLRLSGGNPGNVTNCDSNVWLKDMAYNFGGFGFLGGNVGFLSNNISGVCLAAQSLYRYERYAGSGSCIYQFDCPAGIYEITFLEAETYWTGPGERKFNVFIQGRQVLTNFDIFATAGGMNIPLTLVFTNVVTNSSLQVLFTSVVDNARVSGIQVRKIADVFSDADGIADWWRLVFFGHALGQAIDNSRGSDDADGDGVSNLTEFLAGTDPLNPASFPTPPIFSISRISVTTTNVLLSLPTLTNWSYQLQRRDTLNPASIWGGIGSALPGTGGTLGLGDTNGGTNGARFYRVLAR